MLLECSFGSSRAGGQPKEPPSGDYWRNEPGVWIRVHCEPRTALYVPSEEDLAVGGKRQVGRVSSLGARSGGAAGGQAPTLGEPGPTRRTSLIYRDGIVDYVEDEDVWANGEELSLTKQCIGQTEFLALPLSPTSENPSAEEAVN